MCMTPCRFHNIYRCIVVRHKSIRVLDVPVILVGSFINCSTSYISSISFTLFLLGDSVVGVKSTFKLPSRKYSNFSASNHASNHLLEVGKVTSI